MERNEAREDDLKGTVDSLSSMAEELGNKVALAESLHARVKAVESKVSQANRMVKECTEAGVSPFEEMEVLYSISVAPISNRIKSLRLDEADSMKAEVSRLEVEIEKALLGLKKKKGVLSAWPSWNKGIEALLKKQDKIDPAMLTGIPPEWRPWAMERFVGETELPVVLEGNRISKLKSMKGISKGDIDGVLEEMVGTGRILGGAILRRDGLVISSRLAEGRDPSKVAAMGATAMQKAESASEALAKGEVSYILFNAAEGKQVIAKAGAQALIIAIIKPDEDLGFVILTIKKAGNKVSELIERL